MLSKRALLRAEPGLRAKDLLGGARYYDAQCDDARLALANVRDAHRHGALVANYVRVNHLDVAAGRVGGARITDLVTEKETTVHAAAVVNATGPWSDAIQGTEDRPLLHRTKGVHVVVSRERLGNREAVTHISPLDGRVMFVVPWGCLTYIGTTESEFTGPPETVTASAEDVIYLLRSVNAVFPEARLTAIDVKATWAGIRPLVRAADTEDPNAVSREHHIVENDEGLISIVGGKLTTYRSMAAELVDYVARRLHEHDGRTVSPRAPTDREPLPGGEARDLDVLIESTVVEGFDRETATHLVHTYGSETPAVARLAQSDPQLAQPVVDDHPTLWAELVHAMRREMAITLGDLLIRRTHLFYVAPERILEIAPAIADLASGEMDWDPDRRNAELAAYRFETEQRVAFRAEVRSATE
jgi:glycerol-3-phosphate dehydrogenase